MTNMEESKLLANDYEEAYDEDSAIVKRERAGYESAISAAGYGSFHIKLLIVCGWALSSDAIEILSISFILPPATCDLQLTDEDKGWINSSVFLGMMVGSYIWGTLADFQGRRAVLLWSLSLNATAALASSFAQSTWLFIVLRFVSGIGVGGSMPVIFTYFCEFQPKKKRGKMISLLATFWMAGNIVAAALAWIIIPLPIHVSSGSFSYNSWRVYLGLCILPSLTSVFTFVLMPESPKFLMLVSRFPFNERNKEFKALDVLQRIFSSNNNAPASQYPIKGLRMTASSAIDDSLEDSEYIEFSSQSSFSCSYLWERTKSLFMNTLEMFKPPLTNVSIVMTVIYFTLSFGYYGLFMWLPELFSKVEQNNGPVCAPLNATAANSTTFICDVPTSVYVESFITAASNLPGNIITIFVIDRIGRKIPLVVSMVLSGLLVFFIYFVQNRVQMLVISCLFSGISVIGWNALDVLQPELYPTHLRSSSSGVLLSIGRIAAVLGNTVFGQFVKVNCALPMLMVAAFLGFGGIIGLKLPNTTKRDLL